VLGFNLQYGRFEYVAEVDIRGFFDHLDHEWPCRMLRERIRDEAFIGLGWRFHDGPVAVYDRERMMEMIMEGGSSFDEAMEHFEFNIIGGWVGEFTPMFVVVADGKKIQDEGIYF